MKDKELPGLHKLLDYFKSNRNFESHNLDREQLRDAIKSRLLATGAVDCGDYINYLEAQPDEFPLLLDLLLDKNQLIADFALWNYLAKDLIPAIAAETKKSLLRIWIVLGHDEHEPYWLAIALSEAIGLSAFSQRVKMFVTSPDENQLANVRKALFSEAELKLLPGGLKDQYFNFVSGDSYLLANELKPSIIFGRHELHADPPISHMNLVMCRGTLPYLNIENQQKAWRSLSFSLDQGSYLVVGKTDQPNSAVDLKQLPVVGNVFVKPQIGADLSAGGVPDSQKGEAQLLSRLKESSFDMVPISQLVLDRQGSVTSANARARATFGLLTQDLGRPLRDLEISYRPLELRSLLEQAHIEKRRIEATKVTRQLPNGRIQCFDVYIKPLFDAESQTAGTSIQFEDVTNVYLLQEELQQLTQQLQTANEELQSAHEELETTNEELQSTNEELETTHEELQSTNEELETTHEELQSTNEELETMNEELQSTNAELETINEEQQSLATKANQANSFLHAVLASMRSAVIVLNRQFEILLWNERAAELWGLRSDEIDHANFFTLDIGLSVEKLRQTIIDHSDEGKEHELISVDAINRKGKPIRCQITITSLKHHIDDGVVLLIDEMH